MFGTSIARCTFVVLDHYSKHMDVNSENIVIHLRWNYRQDPTSIKQITMKIYWPKLPGNRIAPVARASHKCTLSTTIKDCVEINTKVFNAIDDNKNTFSK